MRVAGRPPAVSTARLVRLAAFADAPGGGNPAGVWIGPALPSAPRMQAIAAAVGDSETAFLAPADGVERQVRYFSPQAEVPFCGHATIAAGVALGQVHGAGAYRLLTAVGPVPVAVHRRDGAIEAVLRSVQPRQAPAAPELVEAVLALLHWRRAELDPAIAPVLAFAGAWHLVLAAASRGRLARLDYDLAALRTLMLGQSLTTLQLVWRERPGLFHARNPFPVGGVVEDPATGAAAAALAGYLRDAALIAAPATLTILQGQAIGRPSRIEVEVPASGGIFVRGTAVALPDPAGDRIRAALAGADDPAG